MVLDFSGQSSDRRICKLSEETVNRLAAGEIIVRPCHALKELLENSLDASATQIRIHIESGGLDVLQVADNGYGIHKDDLDIICQRFTTSKLQKIEDLTSVESYGFRGEALSSLSLVSKLSITTTRGGQKSMGYSCSYLNGIPTSKVSIVPFEEDHGTKIVAESLFYNLSVRRRSLQPVVEYQRILALVEQYAIHFPNVSFSCRSRSTSRSYSNASQTNFTPSAHDLLTKGIDSSSIIQETSLPETHTLNQLKVIRSLYGDALADALLPLKFDRPNFFSCHGWISRPTFTTKIRKSSNKFTLFINHRLIKHFTIKRRALACLGQYRAAANVNLTAPFWVYLSLQVPPCLLDVNVDPSKKYVIFRHEEIFLEEFSRHLLSLMNTTLIPYNFPRSRASANSLEIKDSAVLNILLNSDTSMEPENSILEKAQEKKKTPSIKRCRVDSSQGNMESFVHLLRSQKKNPSHIDSEKLDSSQLITYQDFFLPSGNNWVTLRLNPAEHPLTTTNPVEEHFKEAESLACLKLQIKQQAHPTWASSPFRAYYVGAFDLSKVFLQYDNKLLLTDLQKLTQCAVYQSIVYRLGRLPSVSFSTPIPLSFDLQCREHLVQSRSHTSWDQLNCIVNRLNYFFSIEINVEKKLLLQFPLCCGSYFPGRFDTSLSQCLENMISLAFSCLTEYDFVKEMSQFLASYFTTLPSIPYEASANAETLFHDLLKFVFYPCVNHYPMFLLPSICFEGPSPIIQEITTVEKLYRVFERC